jgi:hypothetical protein
MTETAGCENIQRPKDQQRAGRMEEGGGGEGEGGGWGGGGEGEERGGSYVAEAGAFDAKWQFRRFHQGQGRRVGNFHRAIAGKCDGCACERRPEQSVRRKQVRRKR